MSANSSQDARTSLSDGTTSAPDARRRALGRWTRLGALVLVPLLAVGALITAFSSVDEGLGRVPAIVVNNDEAIQQTDADGEPQYVIAGRLLVTELTSAENGTFDWTISNSEHAAEALASGDAYVVLTIPEDFSESVISLSGDDPQQGRIEIATDDSHSYLAGVLTETVGTSMAAAFGQSLTEQYIAGIYASIGTVGASFETAADGAQELATGAAALDSGLGELATGAGSAASGAEQYLAGVTQFDAGVQQLSSGLSSLADGTASLGQLADGIDGYVGTVATLEAQAPQIASILNDPLLASQLTPEQYQALAVTAGTLTSPQFTGAGDQLSAGAAGLRGIPGSTSQLAAAGTQLASGSTGLVSGARELSGGIGSLSTGVGQVAEGSGSLAAGTQELADGLSQGADQVPAFDQEQIDSAAAIAANPITATVHRENEVADAGQALLAVFLPVGLWIGALSLLALGAGLRREQLASPAGNGRLVGRSFRRSALITAAQALVLAVVMQFALGMSWMHFPALLGISIVTALAFTAVHQALGVAFGRVGTVVSLLLLVVQLAASGGLYPVQIVAEPFAAISPLLPLSHAVTAMQVLVAGGSASAVLSAVLALAAFGLIALLVSLAIVARRRGARSLGLVPQLG